MVKTIHISRYLFPEIEKKITNPVIIFWKMKKKITNPVIILWNLKKR
jgi:hypothetical protein